MTGQGDRILITCAVDDPDDLATLRRDVAYDRILVIDQPDRAHLADRLVAAERRLAYGPNADDVAQVRLADSPGPFGTAAAIEEQATASERAGDHVVIHVGATDATTTSLLLMVVFRRGLKAIIVQHGRMVQLPSLHGVAAVDMLGGLERLLLGGLRDIDAGSRHRAGSTISQRDESRDQLPVPPIDSPRLLSDLGLTRNAGERALRSLRDRGLVTLDVAEGVIYPKLTAAGTHLAPHA